MPNKIIVDFQEGLHCEAWISNIEPFVKKILIMLGIEYWELSILFCNDDFISTLNKTYRNIDGPTDVLSFELGEQYCDDKDYLWYNAGDIVISLDSLQSNANEFNVDLNQELKRLLIHGILHLNGMDHEDNSPEQEMLQFQEYIVSKFEKDTLYGD